MTPYIEAKKAEFRGIARAHDCSEGSITRMEEFLDSFLYEIESRVMEKRHVGAIPTTDDYANGWNDCRKEAFSRTKEAFQHLRTGVTE